MRCFFARQNRSLARVIRHAETGESCYYGYVMLTIGIDEVGRGCWAGPLVAGAVLLECDISGLADSKKLTARRRLQLDAAIRQNAQGFGLGWVNPEEIDQLGLTKSVALAMQRAYDDLKSSVELRGKKAEVIIDGNINYLSHERNSWCLIKADATIPAVSAASIIAKVARDKYMQDMAVKYPSYGFDRHVGYGTTAHNKALTSFGVTDIHRRSFRPIKDIASA